MHVGQTTHTTNTYCVPALPLARYRLRFKSSGRVVLPSFAGSEDERRFDDLYILDGRTDRGRRLRLVFQDNGDRLARHFHRLGVRAQKEREIMKKRFGKLPKAEREKIETQYHQMKPEKLDGVMSRTKRHTPSAIRLPAQLVKALKVMAESEGESEYQAMVRRWIEERLQQKNSARD